MRVTVVGTGTAAPRLERRQSCVVVETGGELLVFDLGSGAVRGIVRAGLDPLATDRVFFTHFHPDHTVDVVPLLFAMKYGSDEPRTRTLRIAGPQPFVDFWRSITRVWGEWMIGDYPTEVSELPHACDSPLDLPGCHLSWAPARHRPESISYRLDGDDGTFVYTGDTEYAESVVELARGADTLLIECSFPDESPVPGHLTPSAVARIASEAGVQRVVLTHIYPAADELDLAAEVSHGYGGEVILAEDGFRFNV
ncbi:MAG TPA: MBL fold metallo-hydrolase [Rubrobacteraceae bacterium]|nr:MBL fold metallo-hydrolase [Rubrobacteraceae bacterium]